MAFSIRRNLIVSVMTLLPLCMVGSGAYAGFLTKPEACVAIGEICQQGMDAFARNPSVLPKFIDVLSEATDSLSALHLARCDRQDEAEALGYVRGAQLEAVARNPSLVDKFAMFAEYCAAALNSAVSGKLEFDVEGLAAALEQ